MFIRKISLLLLIFALPQMIFAPYITATSYTYDKNGNMTSDSENCYTYNDANKLSTVKNCKSGRIIESYVYDSEGNRVKKMEYKNGTLSKKVYTPDKYYETVELASNSAILATSYYYVNGEIVARENNDGSRYFYLNDHLGSINLLTDQKGASIEATSYYPFGQVRSGGTQSKHLFTGQEGDAGTNLYYYVARYYDPRIARFTQPDTELPDIYDPQQLNRYSYTENNPLKYVDPTGHFAWLYTMLPMAGMYLTANMNPIMATIDKAINDYYRNQTTGQAFFSTLDALSILPLGAVGAGIKEVSYGSKAIRGIDTLTDVSQIRQNFSMGQLGEVNAGIVKNTTHVTSLSGTAQYRIPDYLEISSLNPYVISRVGEVKNVMNLRAPTNQLLDMSLIGQRFNISPELIIDTNTRISSYADDWLKLNNFTIFRKNLR